MKLSRLVIVIIASIAILSSCKKNNQFTIEGKITHAEGDTIYLEELLVTTTKPVAQTKIDKNGEFEFTGEASHPTFYLLKYENTYLYLLVDSTENIVVNADAANFASEYSIEGSMGSVLVRQLVEKLNATNSKLDSLESIVKLSKGNPNYPNLKKSWDEEKNGIVQEQIDFSTNFVLKNPFSVASVFALYQKFDANEVTFIINDLQTMKTAASALNSIYPNLEHVKVLYKNTEDYMKQEKALQVQRFIQENGQNSPEIILPDQDGNEIALSSLQGKVVLLQFWAAKDRGSRIINPVLVEAYKKYKRKGFEIYQVSLDDNRIDWVDAIDKDKLSWINVGDMNGSTHAVSVYNIQTIPYNYLLSKDGAILAQNLKGPAIDKALAQVLN